MIMVNKNKSIEKINPKNEAFFVVDKNDKVIYKNNNFELFFNNKIIVNCKNDILKLCKKEYQKEIKLVFEEDLECVVFNTEKKSDYSYILRRIMIENENRFFFMKKTFKNESDIKGVILDSVTRNSYDIVTFLDIHGKRLYVSPSVSKIFNISKEELLSRNIFLDVHPNDIDLAKKIFQEVAKKPGEIITNVRIRLKHNTEDWVLMEGSIVNLLDLDGVNALVVNSRSIQEVKKLQDNLFENNYKLDGIIKNSQASIFIKDVKGHYLMVNESYQKLLNLEKKEILGKTDFELFSKEQASKNYIRDTDSLTNNNSKTFEEEIVFPNKSRRSFITNRFTLLNADKEVIGFCTVANEITDQKEAQAKLQKSESWFKAIVQNSLDYVTVIDINGNKKYVTPSVKRVLGFTPEEYKKINYFDNVDSESQITLISSINKIAKSKSSKNLCIQIKIKNKESEWVWVSLILNNQISNEYINGILIHVSDISESIEIKKTLSLVNNRHKLMINNSPDIITIKDLEGGYIDINKTFIKLIGKPKKDIIGKTILDLVKKDYAHRIIQNDAILLSSGKDSVKFEEIYPTKNGEQFHLSNKFILTDKKNTPYAICNISTNITDRKKMLEDLKKVAYYDELTGLYNNRSMINKINSELKSKKNFTILSVDIDRFKIINNSLGHKIGDRVIIEFANRICKLSKDKYFVSRFSGDSFIIFINGKDSLQKAEELANSIHKKNKIPIKAAKNEIYLTSSIGISNRNKVNKSAHEYLRDVDNALYQSKEIGRGSYAIFNNEMFKKVTDQLSMESEIIKAIESNDFELYYQPIINYKSKKITHFEALLRWNHPKLGLIGPDKFLGSILEMGYISKLDRMVIKKAIMDVSEIVRYDKNTCVNINISAVQFGMDDLPEFILKTIKKNKITAKNIRFEITESEVLENIENAISIIEKLKKAGVYFVMDDFGIGYSSLNYLRRIPIDMVKIDRSFILNMVEDKITHDIVNTMVNLFQNLNFKVVAEGVENNMQDSLLKNMNIDYVQGYKYGRPMPKSEIIKLLKIQKK